MSWDSDVGTQGLVVSCEESLIIIDIFIVVVLLLLAAGTVKKVKDIEVFLDVNLNKPRQSQLDRIRK